MGIFDKLFGGGSQAAFGDGETRVLTKSIEGEVRRHIANLARADLKEYTFERRRSEYPHARSDLVVYNGAKTAVLDGRELDSGEISFWPRA